MFRRLEGLPLRGDVPSPAQERTPVTPFVTDGIDGDAVRSTRTPSVEQVLAEIAQKSNDRIRPLLKRGVEVGALRRRKLTERLQLARARLVRSSVLRLGRRRKSTDAGRSTGRERGPGLSASPIRAPRTQSKRTSCGKTESRALTLPLTKRLAQGRTTGAGSRRTAWRRLGASAGFCFDGTPSTPR